MSHVRALKRLAATPAGNNRQGNFSFLLQTLVTMGFLVDKTMANYFYYYYYYPTFSSSSSANQQPGFIDRVSFEGADGLTYAVERVPAEQVSIRSLLHAIINKCEELIHFAGNMTVFPVSDPEHIIATLETPPASFLSGDVAIDAQSFRLLRGNTTNINSTLEECYTSAIKEYLKEDTNGISAGGAAIIASSIALACVLVYGGIYAVEKYQHAVEREQARQNNNIEMGRRQHRASSAKAIRQQERRHQVHESDAAPAMPVAPRRGR